MLPPTILDYFDVVRVEERAIGEKERKGLERGEVVIHLEEHNEFRSPEVGHTYRPNGFYEPSTINDFPLRDRRVALILRRRRWVDEQTGKSLADTVEKDYYDVLKDGAASYVADGTETYVSAELNMMDQKLKKLFGIDATEENTDVTDETAVLLADVPEEDKQTLYKDTMKFLAGLYGENTDATEESAAE